MDQEQVFLAKPTPTLLLILLIDQTIPNVLNVAHVECWLSLLWHITGKKGYFSLQMLHSHPCALDSV